MGACSPYLSCTLPVLHSLPSKATIQLMQLLLLWQKILSSFPLPSVMLPTYLALLVLFFFQQLNHPRMSLQKEAGIIHHFLSPLLLRSTQKPFLCLCCNYMPHKHICQYIFVRMLHLMLTFFFF